MKRLFDFCLFSIFINIAVALSVHIPIMDEGLLISCQASGHALYYNCVVKPPIKPDDVAICGALKTSYLVCLAKLNLPYPLIPSTDPDPYAYSPFTPCRFETGHAILYDICPNIPG
jgi:hypothetical protein